ncbi:hypothetical protein PENTCL1PPCAC_8769, partial [Pristionchus entomophagus]
NALYLNQPTLHLARDYFAKPQFIDDLQKYAAYVRDILLAYADNINLKTNHKFCPNGKDMTDRDCAQQVAEWVVSFERSIAMSSWSEVELRNLQLY